MNEQSVLKIAAGLMLASGMSLEDMLRATRKEVITLALINEQGNQCRVARVIGIHRNTLTRQMDELQITHDRRYWQSEYTAQQNRAKKFTAQSASGSSSAIELRA
jgi:DNA-binding NtrC family response regulator